MVAHLELNFRTEFQIELMNRMVLNWSKRLLIVSVFVLVVLASAGAAYHSLATRKTEREFPMPGELVDVGGHRLHIQKRGGAEPAVIIETGLSAASWEYDSIAEGISEFTTVCTYDRAGYGWSDPGPRPRTSQQTVAELRRLLQAAQLKPPYILIGHSWGGVNVRLYASMYPAEVAGLVLLDALNYDSFPENHKAGQLPFLYEVLDRTAALGSGRLALPLLLPREPATDRERQRKKLATMSRTKTIHAVHDELAGQTNWLTVRAAMKHVGNTPVMVISRRIEELDSRDDQRWLETQRRFLEISSKSKFIMAQSKDHGSIEPEVTVEAVRTLVENWREHQGSFAKPIRSSEIETEASKQ